MRFGVCTGKRGAEFIETVKKAGYDYIEGTFSMVKEMEKAEFDAYSAELKCCDIKVETFNGYFPRNTGVDIKVVGEEADFSQLKEYSKIGFEKAALLGGKKVVIGSGKSRMIPEGFSCDKAKDQYAEFLNFCGDLALQYGMIVVIEPLNRKETNFINTVKDGIEMALYTGNKNVYGLADFFHFYMNGEDIADIENAGNMLRHVHVARANADRNAPETEDIPTCKKWSEALKKCGYNDTLTLESRFTPDFETCIARTRPILDIFN